MTVPTGLAAGGGWRSRRGRSRRRHPHIPVAPGWKISNPYCRIPASLRPRPFLDANGVLSACVTQPGAQQLARGGLCHLLTSPHALHEGRRNLALRHPPDHQGRLEFVLATVAMAPEAHATLVSWARDQGLPDEDAPILAAAVQAKADALVTGDRTHVGPLFGRILKVLKIVALSEALALVGFKP